MVNTAPQSIHDDLCWARGSHHYECAVSYIKRLEERLRLAEFAARLNADTVAKMQEHK